MNWLSDLRSVYQMVATSSRLRRRFRRSLYGASILVLAAALMISGSVFSALTYNPDPVIPTSSFAYLEVVGEYISLEDICDLDDPDCEMPESKMYTVSMASSVKIDLDRLITSGHVCQTAIEVSGKVGTMDEDGDIMIDSFFVATDHLGIPHHVQIEAIHANSDLCVLSSEGVSGEEAQISDGLPSVTEKVWNVSAPRGIFTPGSPIILDGIYTGLLPMPRGDQYTFPSAPGSSGSPIFRSDGTLVGIVRAVNPKFEHATYASTLESIKEIESVTRY